VDSNLPLIGITPDIQEGRLRLCPEYAAAVGAAGGLPLVLPPVVELAESLVSRCQGIILSGGDDPIMEAWGRPTHPSAVKVDPVRQTFDRAVLHHAVTQDLPVLGVCFGMQLMGLDCGGDLDQHLPDSCPTASLHAAGRWHGVSGELGAGEVHSRHHQALRTSGSLDVAARSDDGLIEAIRDPARRFMVGVQWHPERTGHGPLGGDLFDQLVAAARELHHAAP
jgi:putative glutamine amidotransferase